MQVELRNYQELDYFCNEAFKALRTNITFCGKDVRVIAVTSSIPNEGKSDVTFNLAHAFAQDGWKVLYIDADNRNSVQTGRMGITEDVMGLSHYLTGKTDQVDDIITATNIDKLYYLFTGPKAPNPTELLGSTRFREMLEGLREQFDYIFIDCPPIGA
ncbi:MAG: CpsD/CapB family tyrosine-protein kinase [Mogibacterium sp.]|nr:CpsD/CapB family tyrosine-protein kinase [Mogibacterium sp.]